MQPIDGNTQINITVNLDSINVILQALGSQQYDRVAHVIDMVKSQATAQLAALATPAPTEPSTAE